MKECVVCSVKGSVCRIKSYNFLIFTVRPIYSLFKIFSVNFKEIFYLSHRPLGLGLSHGIDLFICLSVCLSVWPSLSMSCFMWIGHHIDVDRSTSSSIFVTFSLNWPLGQFSQ